MRIASVVAFALGAAALSGAGWLGWSLFDDAASADAEKPKLAVFTSLPLFWQESDDLGAMLNSSTPAHWWVTHSAKRYDLQPLDALMADDTGGPAPLAGQTRLVLAQPRPLAPRELVNLDDWLRAGGKALIFADPLLTWDSRFSLGDKRRPADTIMLSPLFARWGLSLEVDEMTEAAEAEIALPDGATLPLRAFGRFALSAPSQAGDRCQLSAEAVLALCSIGKGRALLVADSALLEPGNEAHGDVADQLSKMAFE